MSWVCNGGCTCQPTGAVGQREINHTNLWVDVSTASSLNGTYQVGKVWPRSTPSHVVDPQSPESTGPNFYGPPYAGSYTFHIQAVINGTNCSMAPFETEIVTITVYVSDNDKTVDYGEPSCKSGISAPTTVGEPVNVTNCNVYIHHSDEIRSCADN